MFANTNEWRTWWVWTHPDSALKSYGDDNFQFSLNFTRSDVNGQVFVWDPSIEGTAPNFAPRDRRLDTDGFTFLPQNWQTMFPTSDPVDDTTTTQTPLAPVSPSYQAIRAIARQTAQAAQAAAAAAAAAANGGQVQPVSPPTTPGYIPNLPGGGFTTPIPVTPPVVQPPYVPVPTVPAPVINPGTPIVPVPTGPGSGDTFGPGAGTTPPTESSRVLRDLGTFVILTSPAWLALAWIERKKLRRVFT